MLEILDITSFMCPTKHLILPCVTSSFYILVDIMKRNSRWIYLVSGLSSLSHICVFKTAFNLFPKFFKDLYRDIKCLATLCCTRCFFSHFIQQPNHLFVGKMVFSFSFSPKLNSRRLPYCLKKDGCCFLLKSVFSWRVKCNVGLSSKHASNSNRDVLPSLNKKVRV